MKSPFTGGDVILQSEPRTATFRKEEIEYTHLYYECLDTIEHFTTTHLDTINTLQIYNAYRAKNGIPFPDEIQEMRARYSLSASKMSRIIGLGDNQYRLYENGEMPSISNGRVLKAIQSPETFLEFIEAAKNVLSNDEYLKIKKRTEDLEGEKYHDSKEVFKVRFIYENTERNNYNGYAPLSIDKLKNVLLYFIEKFGGVFITQMNKLLFYTDFLAYRECGQAITGLSFRAIQYGPVPNRWDRVYSLIDDVSQVEVVETNGTMLVSNISCNLSALSEEQQRILEQVYETFKNDSSSVISAKSHQEVAWIENQEKRDFIDFKYAFNLKAI